MKTNHPDKLQKAINSVIISHPFYASLLLNQKIVCDNSRKTFSVDGKILRYNSKFLETLTHDETVGVLIHELSHLARFHHTRGKNKDHKLWNESTDYAINNLLIHEGFVLPKCALLGKFPIGECAENIYRVLEKERNEKKEQDKKREEEEEKKQEENNKNQEKNDNGDPQSSNNGEKSDDKGDNDDKSDKQDDNSDDSNDKSDDKVDDESDKDDDSNDKGNKESDEAGDDSQSGNGNNSNDDSEPSFGEVEQTPEKDINSEEERTEVIVKQAIAAAKTRGKLPAYLERISNEVPARHDWKEELSKFVLDVSHSDYTMSRPNKRFIGTGFMLPSLYNKSYGKVLMIRDTSGSIGQNEADIFLAENKSVLATLEQNGQEPKMTIIDSDAEVQQVVEYEGQDSIPLKGGGGTDFNKAFVFAKETNDYDFSDVCCAIYLTDGWGPIDKINEPDFPVLWCLIVHNPDFVRTVPFGECINLFEY